MKCPNCDTQNPDGARFCFNCGNELSLKCSNCDTSLPAGAKFCFKCGQSTVGEPKDQLAAATVVSPAPPAVTRPEAQQASETLQRYIPGELLAKLESARQAGLMEGERRVVTILFCDVKGSTSAASTLDPEEWTEIMNGAFEHMIGPVYQYEGTVARLMGDGLLAFFGAPISHEDDPQRAILAGLDIVRAVRLYAQDVKRQWNLDFDVRIGINTGLVVVGAVGSDLRMEYTAQGDAINLAARMEQTAVPGTVQIAENTYNLVEPLFEFESLGRLEVKGKDELVMAYKVLSAKAEPGSLRGIAGLQAPLIGRGKQLATLREAMDELGRGSGQIISVIGEAGLGKSRLVAELKREVETDTTPGILWVEGRSLSYETNTPYSLFRDLFSDYFGLPPGDDDAINVRRVKVRLAELFPGQAEAMAPYFATMIGLTLSEEEAERVKYQHPQQLRGTIFHHVNMLIERQVAERPMVVSVDDLHWTDPTSLELLQALLPLVDSTPLGVVAAFRPHRQEPSWGFHEAASRDYHYRYQAISLSPLDNNQSRELVANLLEVEDLPEQVRQRILVKSEGNPFFVEEIIRSLLDGGQIVRRDGHWRATQEISEIAIPDTLVGVITARLDKLDENTRQIAQTAAVLGREFDSRVLADIVESPETLDNTMVELQRREIILEKNRIPIRTYTFKHILSQQAAYESILLSNRRELHRRAAESLLERDPEQVADIARHWEEARQPLKAIPYLVQAGDQAARAYATAEAIDFYGQALALRTATDTSEPVRRAYEGMGNVLAFSNQIPEAMETFQEMLEQGETQGDVPMQISALNKLASTVALRMGQFQQAETYLARSESLNRQSEDHAGAAESTLLRCQMCTAQADFEGVVSHMGELVEIGERVGTKDYIATGLEHVASSLMWLAKYDEAQEKAEEALRISREIDDREHESLLLTTTLPMCAIRNGEFERARADLDEGLRIAQKIGSTGPQIFGNWMAGEMAHWQGDYEQALAYGGQALEQALPLEEFMPWMVVPTLGSLGSAYLDISDQFRDRISDFHQHALRLMEAPGGQMTGGTAWADLGFCAVALGDLELADEVFQKGLNYPTMFMYVEKPRLLAGSALLALTRGESDEASRLAEEALAFAQEKEMRHMYPLTHLTIGKVQASQGEVDAALASFGRAEEKAMALNMRPYVWRSQVAAAESLELAGRTEEAQVKRDSARAMVQDISGMFTDEELRSTYLTSALDKVGA
jgi:class 3 adenylate cyclase/tetratricopeptide (TPR) repeat protein